MIEIGKTKLFCKCGKPSVVFDTWFDYYPCKDHRTMSPVEWSRWEPKSYE